MNCWAHPLASLLSSLHSLWTIVFYFSHPPNKTHNSTIPLPLNPCKKYTLWVNLSVIHPFSDLSLTLLLDNYHTSTARMVLLCINKLCSVRNACSSTPTRTWGSRKASQLFPTFYALLQFTLLPLTHSLVYFLNKIKINKLWKKT